MACGNWLRPTAPRARVATHRAYPSLRGYPDALIERGFVRSFGLPIVQRADYTGRQGRSAMLLQEQQDHLR